MPGLVSITACTVSGNVRSARVFITVYPENAEEKALLAIHELQKELRDFLKKGTRMKTIPDVRFIIDKGEQQREKISKLLHAR